MPSPSISPESVERFWLAECRSDIEKEIAALRDSILDEVKEALLAEAAVTRVLEAQSRLGYAGPDADPLEPEDWAEAIIGAALSTLTETDHAQ